MVTAALLCTPNKDELLLGLEKLSVIYPHLRVSRCICHSLHRELVYNGPLLDPLNRESQIGRAHCSPHVSGVHCDDLWQHAGLK